MQSQWCWVLIFPPDCFKCIMHILMIWGKLPNATTCNLQERMTKCVRRWTLSRWLQRSCNVVLLILCFVLSPFLMNCINFVVLDHRVERQPFKRNFADCFCKGGGCHPKILNLIFGKINFRKGGMGVNPNSATKFCKKMLFFVKQTFFSPLKLFSDFLVHFKLYLVHF